MVAGMLMAIGFLSLAWVIEAGSAYTQEDPARTGKESQSRRWNPNTVTRLGSPKEEIRRMPAPVTVSTQIPYGW